MKYEAILFDFDDCLFDTYEDRTDTTVRTLHENGYPDVLRETAHRLLGLPTVERFMATAGIEDRAEGRRLGVLWEETNVRVGYRTAQPFPGVIETLRRLGDSPMGIFSASMTEVVCEVLDRSGLRTRFGSVVGRDRTPAPKPAPDGLFKVCEELGVDPKKCLYVGDTVNDIRAGKSAGMKTFAVTYGIGTEANLLRESPDVLADCFSDLLDFVHQG